MKSFNVISQLTYDHTDETFKFSLSRYSTTKEAPTDILNIRAKIIEEDKRGDFTFQIIDGGYAKLTSGNVFNIDTYFKVQKTSHVNKVIINKQTFIRLDVGTQKTKRYETVIKIFRDFIRGLSVLLRLQRTLKV